MSNNPDPKNELKDVLSLLMEECDIDDAQLSRETGVPASTISRMRINSNANPTAATLRPIAKYFSISISQLLGDEILPKDRLPGTHNPTYYTSSKMPVIEWEWVTNWLENRDSIKEKLWTWISTEKDVGQNTFALIIASDSFGLAFRKGSTIIVDPDERPKDGDLILVKDTNTTQTFLKQLLLDGNDLYMRSINPEIRNILPMDKNHKIIGVIIETRFSTQTAEGSALQKEEKLKHAFVSKIQFKTT